MLRHGGEPLRSLDELAEEITTRAAQLSADTCHWLGLVAEFDERDGWADWGCKSCAHWVAWRCSMELVTAREQVRVARALPLLPHVRAAFAAGELSYTKVRVLTRVDNIEQETELLEMARVMTAEQLRRSVAAHRGVAAVEAGHQRAVERRRVEFWYDDDGMWHLRCDLPAEESAVVQAAFEAARDELNRAAFAAEAPESGDASAEAFSDTNGAAVTNADAFMLMAERSLAAPADAVRSGGEAYQVHIDIDATVLAGLQPGNAITRDGQPLPAETARRIACDATVSSHCGEEAGNRNRTIKPSTHRALRLRDRCCRFPGCTNRRHLDAHHIKHWADGGPTTMENLLLLCRHHHRMHHEGGFRIGHDPSTGELVFARPDGRRLTHTPRPRPRPGCSPASDDFTPETIVPLWDGQHLNIGDAVDAILRMAPLRSSV